MHFFAVFIFAEAGLSAKIAKICTQRKFPAIRYVLFSMRQCLDFICEVHTLEDRKDTSMYMSQLYSITDADLYHVLLHVLRLN